MAIILFDEKFMFYHLLGAIFIVSGITLSNKKIKKKLKVILDDYQNIAQEFVDLKNLAGKYEIKIFSEPFENENNAIEELKDFEALLISERTKYPRILSII